LDAFYISLLTMKLSFAFGTVYIVQCTRFVTMFSLENMVLGVLRIRIQN
jgi:hypothetical protein